MSWLLKSLKSFVKLEYTLFYPIKKNINSIYIAYI
jgi:hypothetical protein